MELHGSIKKTLLCGAVLLSCWPVVAQQTGGQPGSRPRELFNQLNNLSIDPGQIYALRGAQISRDRVKIYFNRGFIGFFEKADGETTGALYAGDGEVLLVPPNSTEKGSLAQFTQSAVLEERFSFAYLRFTDQTAKELMALARIPDPEDSEQPTGFVDQWSPVVRRLNPGFSLRILEDLLGERDRPYFVAQFQGVNLGGFAVAVDERAPEAVSAGATRFSHENRFTDIWCSFPSRTSETRSDSLAVGSVKVDSYKIDTRIDADNSLQGHAELQLESESNADQVLVFLLSNRLRVSEVRDEEGKQLEIFQGQPPGESASAFGADWVAVALPSARPVGSRFRLDFTYQGRVISDVGNGVLYVSAHEGWYPNRGLNMRARYDLTFRYPDRLTLVATGARVEESSEAGWKRSRWVSETAFPVAGFNLGPYDSRLRKIGKTTIEVYATSEAEAALERRHAAATRTGLRTVLLPSGRLTVEPVPKVVKPLAPSALLDQVAEGAARAIRYYESLFGPFPYPRLAIAQIPGDFGQGWPELVYLPTLSFLPEPEQTELGLVGKMQKLQDRAMVAHEIAHQWWGNEVGWRSTHDQWLSEGFASYSALLYLMQEKDGQRMATDLLRGYKHDLMSKTPEGSTIESGGPIWLGERLSNSQNPDGYSNIVYKKACWVLHMLRVLMTDPATGSDERFIRMLRDFLVAYRDSNPSTDDFIRHAAKYMPPALDLEHNHSLNWFFDAWVYGAGIPTYKLKATTRALGPDKYVTQGTIEQSDVPSDFQMLVPVVATYGRGKNVTLGLVAVSGEGGHFRFRTSAKPSHVAIDEDNLLAVSH